MRFRAAGAEVLAETIDRGHRANLGPAIVRRRVGEGDRRFTSAPAWRPSTKRRACQSLRTSSGSLVEPLLAPQRSYEMEYQPGLTPHFMASSDTLLLHLLADTGNKNKHLRPREGFLPVTDVKVRIRVPEPLAALGFAAALRGRACRSPYATAGSDSPSRAS